MPLFLDTLIRCQKLKRQHPSQTYSKIVFQNKPIIMATPPTRALLTTQSLTSISPSELQPIDRTCAICHEESQENALRPGEASAANQENPLQTGEALTTNPSKQPVKLQYHYTFGKDYIAYWLTEHDNCTTCRTVAISFPYKTVKFDIYSLLRQAWTNAPGNENEECTIRDGQESLIESPEDPVAASRRRVVGIQVKGQIRIERRRVLATKALAARGCAMVKLAEARGLKQNQGFKEVETKPGI